MTENNQCKKLKKFVTKCLTDLGQKYDNGIVFKSPPVIKRKNVKNPDDDFEEEDVKVKNNSLYKLRKYQYSLFNPNNVHFLKQPFPAFFPQL